MRPVLVTEPVLGITQGACWEALALGSGPTPSSSVAASLKTRQPFRPASHAAGRHPLAEVAAGPSRPYVPFDTRMGLEDGRLQVVTGAVQGSRVEGRGLKRLEKA